MLFALHKVANQLVKFASVGALNTIIGLSIIYSLMWGLQWGAVSSNLVGYLVCIFLGFVLNSRWTFGNNALMIRHFIGYFMVMIVAYLMNLATVVFSIKIMSVQSQYAQLLGVPVFTLVSYLLNKIFVFSDRLFSTVEQ